jgi:hypothetical protein
LSAETSALFVTEALRIVEEAEKRNVVLRTMGAVAFRIHCHNFGVLLDAMDRPLTDLDFVGWKKQRSDAIALFKQIGYTLDKEMLILGERLKFHNNSAGPDVDVFMDELKMCHTISLRDRLRLDSPTIPLADLLLEKMQIVHINEKDIKDTIVLIRAHPVGKADTETIDTEYISKILANDWGFYYTVTMNLNKARDFLPKYSALSNEDVEEVSARIGQLLAAIESAPKSAKWKMRARVGTRSKWYEDVEEAPDRRSPASASSR